MDVGDDAIRTDTGVGLVASVGTTMPTSQTSASAALEGGRLPVARSGPGADEAQGIDLCHVALAAAEALGWNQSAPPAAEAFDAERGCMQRMKNVCTLPRPSGAGS
jgi:hypothetical protein